MANVYRENILHVHRMLREVKQDWISSCAFDKNNESQAYLTNMVPVSSGTPYYRDFMDRLDSTMTEVTDADSTQTM